MVVVIKDKKDITKAKKLIEDSQPEKKFDAIKFCGALKVDEDPMVIQKRLRDEWR